MKKYSTKDTFYLTSGIYFHYRITNYYLVPLSRHNILIMLPVRGGFMGRFASVSFFCILMLCISITVYADDMKTYEEDEVVVTATKTETSALNVPVNVETVTKEEIDSKQYSNPNVGEIVRDLPGVSVGHGDRNIPPWVHLRGTGYFIGRTLYMADELPLAEPMVSIAAHPSNLSAVEVLLGPSSSLYGPNASGGALNMRSITARDNPGVNVGIGYGEFNTMRPNVSIGKVLGNWDIYGSYTMDKSDGYKNTDLATGLYMMNNGKASYLNYVAIEDEEYTNNFGYGRIGYRNPDNGIGFTVGAHVFNEDAYGGRLNSESDGTRIIGTGKVYAPISDLAMTTLRFGYQDRDSDSQSTTGLTKVANTDVNGRYVYTAIDADNSYVYDPTVSNYSNTQYSRIPLDLQVDFLAVEDHTFTVGASYIQDSYESAKKNADKSTVLSKSEYDIAQTAYYLQDQYKFLNDKATLLYGLRHDEWEYSDIYDSGSTDQTPDDVEKSTTTFRGGVKYQFNREWGIRTSAGTAFWPGAATWFFQNVSTGTIWREANPNLKPERTKMVDFGFDYTNHEKRLAISVTHYRGKIEDAMSYVYDQHPTLDGVQIIRTSNSDEVEIKGYEMSIRQEVFNNVSYFFNYTYNSSEITKSAANEGHQLRNAPDYTGSVGVIYNDKLRGYGGRLSGRFSDDRYYDDENTELLYYHMKEYFCIDAKLWKTVSMGRNSVTTSIGVDNLTDTEYDGEFIYNAPGRFYEFNVSYHFDL